MILRLPKITSSIFLFLLSLIFDGDHSVIKSGDSQVFFKNHPSLFLEGYTKYSKQN
jgi:hypothetical protein